MHHLSSRYIPCDGRLTASAYFDPRSPHRERHLTQTIEAGISYISIHAPRRGSDLRGAVPFHPDGYFNPRSPYEERPIPSSPRSVRSYFNPRSPHGERPPTSLYSTVIVVISIHAPRGGERQSAIRQKIKEADISIHTPRMGSDNMGGTCRTT